MNMVKHIKINDFKPEPQKETASSGGNDLPF